MSLWVFRYLAMPRYDMRESRLHDLVGWKDWEIGVLMGLSRGEKLEDSMRYGVAAGGASVMTDGTQLIKVEDFQALLPKVMLQEL